MPRKKTSYDKDPTHAPRKRPSAPSVMPTEIAIDWLQATGQMPPGFAVLGQLDALLEPGYGRYSVNRDCNGNVYHKFRWSSGKHAGRYVMFVGHKHQALWEGLMGLLGKIQGAEEGSVYTTEDKYR